MTQVAMPVVDFFFDLSAQGGAFYTVQDPVKGKVQTSGYPIAGDLSTAVTSYVINLSVTRGKSRQLDQVQAGIAQITLRNDDRRFDPLNAAGPYYGNIRPGKRVAITDLGLPVFVGQIDDWNFGYDVNGLSVATVTCVDSLGALAAIQMMAWTATAGDAPGTRFNAVLDRADVSFPNTRSLAAGSSTLQADTIADGTNVLTYLQLVTETEAGRMFTSKAGVLTFQGRNTNANQTAVQFSDTGTSAIRFKAVEVSYGTELLYNATIISRVGGSTETFTDTGSVDLYGTRTLSKTDLLYDSDQQSNDLGLYLVGLYGAPELRFSSITVTLGRLTDAQRLSLLGLDLGDVIAVTFTPDGLGAAISRECVIEGIQHDPRPGEHIVTLSLGDTTSRYVFVVQDPLFGVVEGPGVVAF